MNEILAKKLKEIPKEAGVYQYFDENSKLLYIGKAKNLKNRVKSYFRFTPKLDVASNVSPRIAKMLSEVSDVLFIVVNSEHDALILENSLIKQLKPKYNVLLRDDKTYPYIYIDLEQDFPRFEITRKIIDKKKVKYFGPFSTSAKYIMEALYGSFELIQRKNCLREKKSCLFYQIDKCKAPCEDKITKVAYKEMVKEAIHFLMDRKLMKRVITNKMQAFADNLQFEEALGMKKALNAIEKSAIKTPIDFASLENIDIFTIYAIKNKACILKTFIRKGKLVSTDYKIIKDQLDIDINDIYQRVIVDFYNFNNLLTPDNILVAHMQNDSVNNQIENFIYNTFNKKIPVSSPKIGSKKHLIETTKINAKMLLEKSINNNDDDILVAIQKRFKLISIPFRMEAFDNSHISNQAKVGAMIVYEDGAFVKASYRQYHLSGNDEYSFMKELLTRRTDSREKEPLGNLWVIDGGRALLNLAISIIDSLGINLDAIAISKEKVDAKAYRSKGKARDIIYTKEDIYRLDTDNKELLFIQKIRDESHRFAISKHRKLKAKEDKEISLLKIKGIGEAKIVKLINYFGSFESIKKASVQELENVLPKKDAFGIYEYFKWR